jgi:hypothetical protein
VTTTKKRAEADRLEWLELRIMAESFEDVQKARMACNNRAKRSMVRPEFYEEQLATVEASEKALRKRLVERYRAIVPSEIREFVNISDGIGESSMARLLGLIGHPVHTIVHKWTKDGPVPIEEKDRRVSDLWSYCGHGDPLRKRRKGMSQDDAFLLGSKRAKSAVWNIACSVIKQPGRSWDEDGGFWKEPDYEADYVWPYREVYEEFRDRYKTRVHDSECVRCGPSGKPAKPGSKWSPGHQHAAALRVVGKEVLRDLWIVSNQEENDYAR